jgi:hypothetical protein
LVRRNTATDWYNVHVGIYIDALQHRDGSRQRG